MIYEKYPPGSLILKEGDKSNNKFYVVLSGNVSILIRNSENVFISENLEKNFLKRLNKKRRSYQELLIPHLSSTPLVKLPETDIIENENSPKSCKISNQQQSKKKFQKTRTLISTPSKIKKKSGSLIPEILTSEISKADIKEDLKNIEEENIQKEEKPAPILPFFHLGKEIVILKLKEMGFMNKDLFKGEGFGEVALLDSKARRTATVLALDFVELIVILKKDFLLIRQKFSHEYKGKKQFLVKVLPFLKTINSSSTLDNLIFCFKEMRLTHRQRVISETDENPDKMFFLNQGKCKIEKTLRFFQDGVEQTRLIHICDVDYKGILGEEILFSNEKNIYHYTVTVTSEEAFFYTVQKNTLLNSFPKEIKVFLYETFLMKKKLRQEIFNKFSQKLIENIKSPQIQTMIDLKINSQQKIMKNMNLGLRVSYYQKLKKTINEDFTLKGGSHTGTKWDPDLIFENLKQTISQRKGLEKFVKIQKFNKALSLNQILIRKEETKENDKDDELMGITSSVLCETNKRHSLFPKKTIEKQEITTFNFDGEQQNHRSEVFRRAKIGKFKGPIYKIPHDRIYKNLWEKTLISKEKREVISKKEMHLNIITKNPTEEFIPSQIKEKTKTAQKKKSRAQKNLKEFLLNIKYEGKEIGIWKNVERLHSSQNMKSTLTSLQGQKSRITQSFSKHLLEVQRINSSLKKTTLKNTKNAVNIFKSDKELLFD